MSYKTIEVGSYILICINPDKLQYTIELNTVIASLDLKSQEQDTNHFEEITSAKAYFVYTSIVWYLNLAG